MDLEWWRAFCNVMIFVFGGGAGAFTLGAYVLGEKIDQKNEAEQAARETEEAAKSKQALEVLATVAEGNQKLQAGNQELKAQLAPFAELASRAYPELERTAALERLRADLARIDARTSTVEKRLEKRLISDADRARIVEALKPHAGTRIRITRGQGEAEIGGFAAQLKAIFLEAGWAAEGNQVLGGSFPPGVHIVVKEKPPAPFGDVIFDALKPTGFLAPTGSHDPSIDNPVQLIIGPRE